MNVRRRVYDILNILISSDIVHSDNKVLSIPMKDIDEDSRKQYRCGMYEKIVV